MIEILLAVTAITHNWKNKKSKIMSKLFFLHYFPLQISVGKLLRCCTLVEFKHPLTWMDWAIWVMKAGGSFKSLTVFFANITTSESGSMILKRCENIHWTERKIYTFSILNTHFKSEYEQKQLKTLVWRDHIWQIHHLLASSQNKQILFWQADIWNTYTMTYIKVTTLPSDHDKKLVKQVRNEDRR